VQKRRADKDAFVILLTPETARAGERLFLPSLPDLVSTDNTPGAHAFVRRSFVRRSSQSHVCDCEVRSSMILTIKKGWRRSPAAALMRCGGCRPLPRRGVGGLSPPLSVAAASCRACRTEPLLPVDDMEVRELGEQFHLRPFHLCQDLSAHCVHLIVRVEAAVDAHEDPRAGTLVPTGF